uniref:Neuroblastoma-amplified sequence n=1 Tax=Angiostrongylus cantonensis TaxID=6313 RepID=A0A0K0CVZ8_ANGCA
MKRPRRCRYESELDYRRDAEENSKILLKEKYEMLRWTDTVEINTPNLLIPAQIANYVESLPFCKLAVSPLVLEDEFAQYCLLEFTASGSLLLSTRSTAQIDVFDHQGGYCYDISLWSTHFFKIINALCFLISLQEHPENNLDLVCAISSIRTVANNSTDDKYLDILYVLQYNGTLSVYKIGYVPQCQPFLFNFHANLLLISLFRRLSRFQKIWSVSLGIGLAGTFCVLPRYNLLLVSSHYRVSNDEGMQGGLCSFRLMDYEPFFEPMRLTIDQGGWLSRLPFSSANYTYLVSMTLNESLSKLAAVSGNGDFFLFDVGVDIGILLKTNSIVSLCLIPSTRILFSIKYIFGPRPIQVVFTEDEEVALLFHSGELVRSSLDELRDSIHSLRSCEKFTSRTTLVAPCPRELFCFEIFFGFNKEYFLPKIFREGDHEGTNALREAALQRTSLACRLWLYTLWRSLKKVVEIAVGDSTIPLEKATYSESLDFVLLHSPTRTLQELFERTLNERDYSRAKSLAESYDTIDIDIVLKREWRDICHSQTITVESVDSILRKINDKDWIVEACISSDAPNLLVQKALVDLGTSFPNAALASQVRLHHNARMLAVCECVNEYIEVRNLSCLDAAYRFAERLNLVLLDRLVERNYSILAPFMLDITSHIPTSVPPSRFEHLLPTKNGRVIQLDKVLNSHLETMFLLGTEGGEDIMDLELKSDLESFVHYNFFITACYLVGETFNKFCETSPNYYVSLLHNLPEGDIVRKLPEILSLLEWKSRDSSTSADDLRKTVLSFLLATSQHNVEVLQAMQNQTSFVLDRDIVIQCLCCLELTGDALMRAVISVGACPDLACSLSTLHSRGVKPTFKQLWESTTDAYVPNLLPVLHDGARRLLIRMARCGQAASVAEWEALRDEVVDLTLRGYSDATQRIASRNNSVIFSTYCGLISPDEALSIVTREVLSDTRISHDRNVLKLFLTLDENENTGNVNRRLNIERSAEVLIAKSEELLQEAQSPSDPVLRQSRSMAEAAKTIAPIRAKKQLKFLDTVNLAHELGSTALPVAIKFAEPHVFLEEVVKLDGNYKQGRKCAELALLLGVETPVATALSLCALSALVANDERYLGKYIREVMTKGHDLPVVHQLCIRIMESPFVPEVTEEIYACALLNCPADKLMETLDLIEHHSSARKQRFCQELAINDKLVIDPMYARVSNSFYIMLVLLL